MFERSTMKFKIGDKVRFMAEKGGGIVRRFGPKDTVYVEIEDGFEIPVKLNEIVYAGEDRDARISGKEREAGPSAKTAQAREELDFMKTLPAKAPSSPAPVNVYLAFTQRNPEAPGGSVIDAFLINDSRYDAVCVVNYEQQGVTHHHSQFLVEGETRWHIDEFSQSELSKMNAFHVQGLFFQDNAFLPLLPMDAKIPIQDIQFYKQKFYRESEYFDQPAVQFEVYAWTPASARAPKVVVKEEDLREEKKTFHPNPKNIPEVDLHIEKLDPGWKKLPPQDILNIQIGKFRDSMAQAMQEHWKQVVFIHGVGDGRLMFEIRKLIDSQFPDARYQDASYIEYGYGATLVFLEH